MDTNIKITPGIIMEIIDEEDFKIIQGEDLVEKHFSDDNCDMNLSASDLYVVDKKGRTIRLFSDYEEISFEIL